MLIFVYSRGLDESSNVDNHGNVIKDRADWNANLSQATNNGKVVGRNDPYPYMHISI